MQKNCKEKFIATKGKGNVLKKISPHQKATDLFVKEFTVFILLFLSLILAV
jgi:hypothetical protein